VIGVKLVELSNEPTMPAKPFLRWAGGKTWLIKHIDGIIGKQAFNNYHEPFLGGGAVFFHLQPPAISYLSDLNRELIDTYKCIKECPEDVIRYLETFENTEACYYRIRRTIPNRREEVAARFIFLNQTSFNGLYRVNQQGVYNVPYGYRTKPFLEEEKLLAVSLSLKNAVLNCGDFDSIKSLIQKDDLIFLDPPYTVSHNNNGFIKYNRHLFSLDDQYRLRKLIDYIKSKGAFYILTNAAHQTIAEIFESPTDRKIEFSRANLIGGENAKRGHIQEYVFTNIQGGQDT